MVLVNAGLAWLEDYHASVGTSEHYRPHFSDFIPYKQEIRNPALDRELDKSHKALQT